MRARCRWSSSAWRSAAFSYSSVAWSIQTFGWRATAFGSGVIAIVVGWPLARVFKSRPEDHGETIDGLPPAPKDLSPTEAAPVRRMFTPREALRTSAFWLISLGHAFSLLVVSAVNVHAITHMKEGLGYSLAQAAFIITLVTVGQFFGVMGGWVLGDKFVKRKIAAVCMLMHAAGLLILTYATSYAILALAALIHGAAWGLRGPFMQAIRADYFGRRSIGMIMGLSNLITVFGQIGGPLIAGIFADWTGDYRVGFTILAVLAGFGVVVLLDGAPPALTVIARSRQCATKQSRGARKTRGILALTHEENLLRLAHRRRRLRASSFSRACCSTRPSAPTSRCWSRRRAGARPRFPARPRSNRPKPRCSARRSAGCSTASARRA